MDYRINPEDFYNAYQSDVPKSFNEELDNIYDETCSRLDSNTQTEEIYKSVDNLWKQLIDLCNRYSLIDFDDKVADAFKDEIISELLSTLAVQTSPTITGVEKFIKKAGYYGYTNKSSPKTLEKWIPKVISTDYFYPPSVDGHFTVNHFVDDNTKIPYLLNSYFHVHISVNPRKTTNAYSFMEYGAYLTNGLLRFFCEKDALSPSKNYLAYNEKKLFRLYETLQDMYHRYPKEQKIIEMLLLVFQAEELFHISYFIYGFKFLSSIFKSDILNSARLIFIKDFFYAYKLTFNISSETLKLHYLKLFCEDPKKYFSFNNGITWQPPTNLNEKIHFAEFTLLPFIKSTFRYWLYKISQNMKLVHLSKINDSKDVTDNFELVRYFNLILNYMESGRGESYIKKSVLSDTKPVYEPSSARNSDFKAFIFQLMQIYNTDPNMQCYFSLDKQKLYDNLQIMRDIKLKIPQKQFPKELLDAPLGPCFEHLHKMIYCTTFPFNEDYMNYLFFTTYPGLT